MSLKDEYLEKFKAQLDEWSADIDELETRARLADAELRDKIEEQLSALRTQRDSANAKFMEIHESAGDAWQELIKGGDEAWESIKSAVLEARKKFGG
jgi:uncharacterized coiled-coil DUF342 family protein